MEVLSPSKKHTQALEMVSEEEDEEEAALLDSEHEEGEICSEEDDEVLVDEGEGVSCPVFQSSNYDNSLTYPTHFSFQERRTGKKPPSAAVASEVVIYDDSGRTAIFTSPKKVRVSSYPRRSEGTRQHAWEGPRRKDKEVERGRRHHSSAAAAPDKWTKATRRSVTDSKNSGVSEESHVHSHKGKEVKGGHRVRRSRQSSPDSTSGSSSCSCSSSTSSISCSLSEEESDVASVSLRKGRGKENRRCGPSSKGHDRSPPPREYGCERPPPPSPKVPSKLPPSRRSSKHSSSQHRASSPHSREARRRPSYHHNVRRSSKDREVGKASHHHQQHRTHQKSSKAKPSERKEATKPDNLAKEVESATTTGKGQNWLPRGSLGEMLLSRPKTSLTQPAPTPPAVPRVAGEDPKTPVKAKKEDGKVEERVASKPSLPAEAKELSTLDQEDDEELQLRLIAIQSSLRLLTDMQKEGQQLEGAGEGGVGFILPTNKDAGTQERLEDLPLPSECIMGPLKDMADPGSYTPPFRANQMPEIERTLLGDITAIHSTDDIISISSSSASEICIENLATNKSYLEAVVEEGNEGGDGRVTDDMKRKLKERQDVDQNPVDMEICNSSGEDEDGPGMVVVQDSPLSPDPGQDAGQGSSDPTTKGEGVAQLGDSQGSGGNFQIPVEWAYMVPPPPPPDQPANDIQNISSWCFDQNMYLQSMQAAPTEEQQQQQHQEQQHQQQQQQQHSQPDLAGAEWPPPQPHTAAWPSSFMESYDNNLPSGIPDNSAASVPVSFAPEQHEYPPPQPPQPQEASPEQSKDLKDVPAEQYQAFMSAVLQQHSPTPKSGNTFTECPQRNLILVPLNGNHHSEGAASAASKITTKKIKAKKLRAKKRRLKKQRTQDNLQQIPNGSTHAAAAAAAIGNASVEEEEEEDEDLLRAQLLIDMSKKKEQRVLESQSLPATATTAFLPQPLPAPFPAPLPAPLNRAPAVGREGYEGRASPQTLLQSPDAGLPVPRKHLRKVKGFGTRPRSGENSPTHTFRADMRPGLSDIGGWGLDPKGSKFNYHNTQHDFPHGSGDAPKIKFPPIKPIIISLKSDSEDSEEDDHTSRASSMDSGKKEAEVEGLASEPMSQSIDILLKSMRNANTTTKEAEPTASKAGPSTPSTVPPRTRKMSDSTPQAVRHLSRHQQEEYRWLKEQLRKKEMLQRKKMQQRPLRTKPPQPPLPPPLSQSPINPESAHTAVQGSASPTFTEDSTLSMSPAKETPEEAGTGGTSSSTRAVTWKDMGLLQIQVSNEAALDASNESEDSSYRERQTGQIRAVEGDSSVDVSATEDEDEETLRMMALLTQKKKKAENSTENQNRRVVIEESKAVEDKETHPEARDSEDTLADTRNEDHADEGMKGEWMVLDEVREEGIETGEEELCIRPELSENEMEECGEGVETSDSTESVTRSPERTTQEEVPEDNQQDTPKTFKNNELVSRNSNVDTSNIVSDTDKAALVEPASEGGDCTIPEEEKMQGEPPPLKSDTEQITKASPDGEKIEEVIRRIESKTKGVRDKADNECLPLESSQSNVSTQGNARQPLTTATCIQTTKKQQGAELPSKAGTKMKGDQGVAEVKEAGEPCTNHTEEANTHTLLKTPTTPTTTTASTDTQSKGAAGSQSKAVTKITAEKRKEGISAPHRTVISPDASLPVTRMVKIVRPAVEDLQEKAEKEAPAVTTVAATTTTGTTAVLHETQKSPKTQLQLKKLEKEYKEKKNGINKMIVQLGNLLHEVNEEQNQRQTLKKNVGELRTKLKEMEAQLESKSNAVQTKMKHIRRFQQQLGTEQQALNLLKNQGEMLGRTVHGSGYSLPKALPSSPNSKTKDVHMKKALANSIHALRQQVRDLTKRKNNIASGATNVSPTGVETRVVKTLNLETKKESVVGGKKVLPQVPPVKSTLVSNSQVVSRTVPQGKVPSDTSGKPQGKEGIVAVQNKTSPVKRKLVLGDVGAAKVAKAEVPMEGPAIQDRGVRGVPSQPNTPKTDDTEVGEKLDEMKALCPHDLLGRCNDTTCQYQHLPSARPSLQATTKGSVQGTEPPVATTTTTTMPGRVGKREASGGKTGAKGKMVPGGGSKGGCKVAGRAVPDRLTADLAETVSPESRIQTAVQEWLTETTTLGPNKQMTTTSPVAETHRTQQGTPNSQDHIQTPNTTGTEQIASPSTTATEETTTFNTTDAEQTTIPNTTDTEQTATPNTTDAEQTTTPNTTDTEQTGCPNTTDTEQTEMHEPDMETDSKHSSEGSSTEITQLERIGSEPQTGMNPEISAMEPQQTEMPETPTVASAIKPALEGEAAIGGKTSSAPQAEATITELQDEAVVSELQTEMATQVDTQTSTSEPQTEEDNLETLTQVGDAELNLKTVRDDRPSGSDTRTEDEDLSVSTLESQSSSSTGYQPLRRRSKKTGRHTKKCKATSRAAAEEQLHETASGQEGQDTEESVTSHEEGRVTRKSLRVQAKVSPKSNTSQDSSAMPSPRKSRKRKSGGEETTAKSPSSKRRYPTRP